MYFGYCLRQKIQRYLTPLQIISKYRLVVLCFSIDQDKDDVLRRYTEIRSGPYDLA